MAPDQRNAKATTAIAASAASEIVNVERSCQTIQTTRRPIEAEARARGSGLAGAARRIAAADATPSTGAIHWAEGRMRARTVTS